MNMATRALLIGCGIEAVSAMPMLFAGFGPCSTDVAGLVAMLLHLPGILVGSGLQALLGLTDAAAMVTIVVAQVAFWALIAWAVMRVRRRWPAPARDPLPSA